MSEQSYYDIYLNLFYKNGMAPDPEDYSSDKEFRKAFFNSPWYKEQKYFFGYLFTENALKDSSDFSNTPIEPEILVEAVRKQYLNYNDSIPIKTENLVKELCKGFNQAIYFNKTEQPQANFVYPAQTGSAKSLTSKMYVALLKNESSILVMNRVDQVIEAAKDINNWSGDPNYCRCYYRVSSDNPHNPLRIDRSEISNYRCILMTHAMFIRANET